MLLEHKDKDISSLINDDDQFDETPLHLAAKKVNRNIYIIH